ncbi:lipocalin family protein [Aurantibacter sp.]|uniref:lipocalin family protein n=1 Tax=Aurantibacter sp. TaxID=2807103 RepID=UPI0035C7BD74
MKKILLILILLVSLSCSESKIEQLKHINGYWEIEEVITEYKTKTYTFSETIDYIVINDSLKGFRQKLKPRFDGKFETNNVKENIQFKIENDSLNLYYRTAFSEFKETVIKATEQILIISNNQNTIYKYKRYQPFNLD